MRTQYLHKYSKYMSILTKRADMFAKMKKKNEKKKHMLPNFSDKDLAVTF